MSMFRNDKNANSFGIFLISLTIPSTTLGSAVNDYADALLQDGYKRTISTIIMQRNNSFYIFPAKFGCQISCDRNLLKMYKGDKLFYEYLCTEDALLIFHHHSSWHLHPYTDITVYNKKIKEAEGICIFPQ